MFSYPVTKNRAWGTAAPTIIGLTPCPNNSMALDGHTCGYTLLPTIHHAQQVNGTGHTCGYTLLPTIHHAQQLNGTHGHTCGYTIPNH